MTTKTDPFDYVRGKIPRHFPVCNTVVFFDVVGFTKIPTNEKMEEIIEAIEKVLNSLLYGNYDWDERDKHNHLILIPTGDGYAIGFNPLDFHSSAVLDMALNIYNELLKKKIPIRMGIAKGPNIRYVDLNESNNLFGFGINMANRMMGLARKNQILVHEDLAKETKRNGTRGAAELLDIGEYKIRHGQKVTVYNYYKKDEFGMRQAPARQRIEAQAKRK
ncbi:MAG: adenylate/guanylate cyclase domain-containing protein [Candidatus Aminicenantales bacterium]